MDCVYLLSDNSPVSGTWKLGIAGHLTVHQVVIQCWSVQGVGYHMVSGLILQTLLG